MNDREATFVEEMGHYLGSLGMTPMAGRMWAWLLICDPEDQTAGDLADELRASRGAISTAAHQLATIGLIRRSRRRGERREYLSIPPGAVHTMVGGAAAIYHGLTTIAAHGMDIVADQPPARRQRIEELHGFLSFIEQTLPSLMADYLAQRDAAASMAYGADGRHAGVARKGSS